MTTTEDRKPGTITQDHLDDIASELAAARGLAAKLDAIVAQLEAASEVIAARIGHPLAELEEYAAGIAADLAVAEADLVAAERRASDARAVAAFLATVRTAEGARP